MALSELSTGQILANSSARIPIVAYGSLPAAAAANGMIYKVYDPAGVLSPVTVESDGVKWRPINGVATLYQHGEATSTTNANTETNLVVIPIPAGLLSAQGSIRLTAQLVATGANNTKTPHIRLSGTSGDTSGGTDIYNAALTAAQSSAAIIRMIWNRNATNSQVTANVGNPGSGNSTNAVTTPAIATASAWYINMNGLTANSGDTFGYGAMTGEWLEP